VLHILYGADDFSRHEALQQIKAHTGAPDMVALNAVTLDGKELTLAQLRQHCDVLPFLSPQRLVIVENLLSKFDGGNSAGSGRRRRGRQSARMLGEWADLAAYVPQMPESTILVVVDGDVSRTNPLLASLSPHAQVRVFEPLKGASLTTWITDRVSKEGASITRKAARLLSDLVGGDLWTMSNELEKLRLLSKGGCIDEEHVQRLTASAQEMSIFSLVDAVAGGEWADAQGYLRRLYLQGTAPGYILSMLTRQYRLLALANDLPKGSSRQQIREQLGLSSEYAIDKTLGQAQRLKPRDIHTAYNLLLEADRGIKSGRCEEQTCLQLLVNDLARCQA
jgi:DNA polymerase-3 subunit delta